MDYRDPEERKTPRLQGFQKRYATATGKICGTVLAEKAKDGNTGVLSFLSTAGDSPRVRPTANVNPDGSFYSGQLGPGKYYLYFARGSDAGPISAAFYPGVSERTKATTIEINAGQTRSNISFKVPVQNTYSVRGIRSTNDQAGLGSRSVYVSLLRLDGGAFLPRYSLPINFESAFPRLRVKYFDFENVLPGRYLAYVSVFGQGWYTKKEEVNVTTHMKFISLQLVHQGP